MEGVCLSSFFFACICSVLLTPFVGKTVLSSLNLFLCKRSVDSFHLGLILSSLFCSVDVCAYYFANTMQKNKILRNNFTNMSTTRTLKTTKNSGDLNTWRDIPSSWSREHSVIVSIFPKFIYRFGAVLFKIPVHFCVESAMLILKFTWI